MYHFRLTEEIARWAFEIICRENPNWYIAFTNPTAGPWKTIKGLDKNDVEGEVYRFELEETRPDIILVNDQLKIIIIVEAKDSIEKLTHGNQAYKSVEVVDTLQGLLKSSKAKSNPFWNNRAAYTILTGLLWGAKSPTSASERSSTFDEYYDNMHHFPRLTDDLIVGVETRQVGDGLQCYFCGKTYGSISDCPDLDAIASSFGLPII
jgi:hypothetical protein